MHTLTGLNGLKWLPRLTRLGTQALYPAALKKQAGSPVKLGNLDKPYRIYRIYRTPYVVEERYPDNELHLLLTLLVGLPLSNVEEGESACTL